MGGFYFMPRLIRSIAWTFTIVALFRGTPAWSAESRMTAPLGWRQAEGYYFNNGRYTDVLRLIDNVRRHLELSGKTNAYDYLQLTIERGVVLTRGLGDHEAAARAFAEADDLCIRFRGAESPERLQILNRQCEVLAMQKKFADAAKAGREAVRLATKVRGPEHRDTAEAMHYLALPLADLPDTKECISLLEKVLEMRRKTDGEEGYWTGLAWNNLGTYYLQLGRMAEATRCIEKGAAIFVKHASGQSPDGIAIQRNLIRVAVDSHQRSVAIQRAETLLANELNLFRKSFPSLDESGRLNMKSRFEPGRWFCSVGAEEPIARALLQTKAITLDQEMVAAAPGTAADPFAHLLRPQNAAEALQPFAQPKYDARRKVVATPTTRTVVGPTVSIKHLTALYSITPTQVCAALPERNVVVEIAHYKHYIGKFQDEVRYGALVFLPKGESGRSIDELLHWIPLGPAAIVDAEVDGLLENVGDPLGIGTVASRLKKLHELIWAPVAKVVPAGTSNVFVSPDGALCFLPFSALMDASGAFLADRHLFMYLSTTRDLFRADAAERIDTDQFVVFAAPSFGQGVASAESGMRFRDADAKSLSRMNLADLPGARREGEVLQSLATSQGLATKAFFGSDATKVNVRRVSKPRLVHFATHGFMLPALGEAAGTNPMERSGLALAGAQVSLRALREGKAMPAVADDGLLTARQVAALPWKGTWLVALSACDSGRGDPRDGESVLGLRRGFLAAGVENLLLSLWRISDDETVDFMRDFYGRALKTSDAATALAVTQREWLGRIRQERGIAAAVSIAGGFVLNCSGRIPLRPSD